MLQTFYHSSSPSMRAPKSRSARRRRKFISILAEGLRKTPGVSFLGKDRQTERLFQYFSEFAEDICVHRVRANDAVVTILGIPNTIWYNRSAMASLNEAIRHHASHGHLIASAPQRAVEALVLPGAPSGGEFFRALIDAAFDVDMRVDWHCSLKIQHHQTGCLAMKLATGSPCQH